MSAVPAHLKIAVSVADAAELLDLSEPTVRRLVADGHIARIPHTARLIIARTELERYANSGRVAS